MTLQLAHSGELTMISSAGSGPGAGQSGFLSPWSVAPVSADGTVMFISDAPGFHVLDNSGLGWDVFLRHSGGTVQAVSILPLFGNQADPKGQATGVAFSGGFVAEVRDEQPKPSPSQQLLLRSLSNLSTFTRIVAGSKNFGHPRFSDNGLFLVFEADDNTQVSTDRDGLQDIYLYNVVQSQIQRISVPSAVTQSHANRFWPDVANSGTRVVFQSRDNGFVANDTNFVNDIFLWSGQGFARINLRFMDGPEGLGRQTETAAEQPVISGDGGLIFYVCDDPYLVPGDTNGTTDIFRYDIAAKQTTRVNLTSFGLEANGPSDQPDCDEAGQFAVFRSQAANFPGARSGVWQIYVYDTVNHALECVSLDRCGVGADSDCLGPTISPSGRYITFASAADNLPGGPSSTVQVYRYDRGPGFLTAPPVGDVLQVSCVANRTTESNSCLIRLAGNDAETAATQLQFRVTGITAATLSRLRDFNGDPLPAVSGCSGRSGNLSPTQMPLRFRPAIDVTGVIQFTYQIFDGDVWSADTPVRITVLDYAQPSLAFGTVPDSTSGSSGTQANGDTFGDIGISGDGRWIVFSSTATNLTYEETGGIFLRDKVLRRTFFLGNANSQLAPSPVISAHGNAVAFIRAMPDGSSGHQLIWIPLDEAGPAPDAIMLQVMLPANLSISGDGSTVIFETSAQLLPDVDQDNSEDVYLWRPLADADAIQLISQGITSAEQTDLPCGDPYVSGDGRTIAFLTKGGFGAVGGSSAVAVWLKYLASGRVYRYAMPAADAADPSLSYGGQFLAYQAGSDVVVADVWAMASMTTIAQAAQPRLAVDGRYLYCTSARQNLTFENSTTSVPNGTHQQAYRYNLVTGEVMPLSLNANGEFGNNESFDGELSANGSYAAFVTNASNLLGDDNGVSDVVLADIGPSVNTIPAAVSSDTGTIEDNTTQPILLPAFDNDKNQLRFEVVGRPTHGWISEIQTPEVGSGSPTVTYHPDHNFTGTDAFSFRVFDGTDYSNIATISIAVQAVHDPVLSIGGRLLLPPGQTSGQISNSMLVVTDLNYGGALVSSNIHVQFSQLPANGSLRTNTGDLVGTDILYSALPLTYTVSGSGVVIVVDEFQLSVRDVLDPANNDSETVTFQIFSGVVAQSLAFHPGWNLISLPVDPVPVDPVKLFVHHGVGCVRSQTWQWHGQEARLHPAPTLTGKRGYWAFSVLPITITDVPTIPDGQSSAPAPSFGWNLVGTEERNGQVILSGMDGVFDKKVWTWDPTTRRFVVPVALELGKGYWVNIPSQSGSLER